MIGELLMQHREHFGSRLSIKHAPHHHHPDAHMHALLFFSIQVHLEESKPPRIPNTCVFAWVSM